MQVKRIWWQKPKNMFVKKSGNPQSGISNRSTGDVNSEDHHHNHEPTTQEVLIEVVALWANPRSICRYRMGILESLLSTEQDQPMILGFLHIVSHRTEIQRVQKARPGCTSLASVARSVKIKPMIRKSRSAHVETTYLT
jgi:hypothetical protein